LRVARVGVQGLGFYVHLWGGSVCADPCQRRSHGPPVRVGEVTVSGLCCIEPELEIAPPGLALVCGDNGALGTRARDFRTGPPAFHVEPVGARGRGYQQVRIGGVRPHDSH